MALLAALVMACEAAGEDCEAILADEAVSFQSVDIIIRNTGGTHVKLFGADECDQSATKIDPSTLPDGWQWDLSAGPACPDLLRANTAREGACWYPDPVDVASGTEIVIPLRLFGFEQKDVPPACSDEPFCYARRFLPAGRYTLTTWIGTSCPGPTPAETCDPCDATGEICRDGFYIREARFEIDLESPAQQSITIEI